MATNKIVELRPRTKPLRNRRMEYKLSLYRQAAAGDIGAVAEVLFAAMRDALKSGEFCPYYWAESGIAAVRKLRRRAGKKALIGRKGAA